jgi:hypothetical protein
VVGQVEDQVVLDIKEHPKPLGDHHMVIGEHERHSVGHDVSQSLCWCARPRGDP